MSGSILIRNARIMAGAPAAMVTGDLLIEEGRIRAIGRVPALHSAVQEIEASGKLVLPGLVDPHTHYISDGSAGYRMLIASGVTTALDTIALNGAAVRNAVSSTPVGLNSAAFYLLMPGRTLANDNPSKDDIVLAIRSARQQGLYGLKIAGAHFPFTPEAMERVITLAAENRIPLMIHAGSTQNRDDLEGMREMLNCCGDHPAILAHINLYSNGASGKTQQEESKSAIAMLEAHPRVVSESTFSVRACVGCRMVNGIPESLCMRDLLRQQGYEETYDGLLAALTDGAFSASGAVGDFFEWLPPEEGVALAKARGGQVTVSTSLGDHEKNLMLLEARRGGNGPFVINAFSSDGGVIPRNIVLDKGLEAVEKGRFTLSQFVERACWGGAWMLGLDGRKGLIAEGADGDVVIVDEEHRCPAVTISGGTIVYRDHILLPCENRYISEPDHTPTWLN